MDYTLGRVNTFQPNMETALLFLVWQINGDTFQVQDLFAINYTASGDA